MAIDEAKMEIDEAKMAIDEAKMEIDEAKNESSNIDKRNEPNNFKIFVKKLSKIFGESPVKALEMLKQGFTKDEILQKTRQAIGIYDIEFKVLQGEIFVLMGLSGSGKSTLLRCINRLIEPTSGQVIIDGEDITIANEKRLLELRRRTMSMVFQRFALFPHRTILDNVAYGLEIQGIKKEERYAKAQKVLEMVGLKEYTSAWPSQLSGGMQQRVGLARALVNDPDILLMDEAFSALDPLIRRDMQNELLSLQSKVNKTIIFVTHDLDEALKIGDRIALMKDGNIVQTGTPEEILTRPANEYVARFVQDVDMAKVLTAEGVMKSADAVRITDGPRVALRRMRDDGISSIFVITREQKFVGIVTADDALASAKTENRNLGSILIEDVPKATPQTPIVDLIPVLAEAKYPVAVLDDQEHLLGIIVKGTLLASLVRQ